MEKQYLTNDMTEGNIIKHLIRFAVPLLISTVFQQCYSLADTMIVSHNLGENALAALGATTVIYTLLIVFSSGLNSGYGIIISRAFGAKNQREIQKSVAAMIMLNVLIAMVMTILSIVFIRTVMRWLNTPEDIFEMAYSYIIIILGGLAATVCYNMWDAFLRAVGNSRTSLYFLVISCILNIVLDILFVVNFQMGIKGAAAATVLAQGCAAVLSGVYIYLKYKEFLPGRREFRLDLELMGEMLFTGLAMGIMLSVNQIGSMILQRAINDMGTTIITAHTAARKVYEFMMMPLAALANANAVFVGQNYGAEKFDRIRESIKKVLYLETGWFGISCVAAFPLGEYMIYAITGTSDPLIVGNANLYLRMSVAFFFPLSVLFVLRTSFQSMGYKIAPILSSMIELSVKIFVSLLVIPQAGYWAVTVTEPVSWLACAAYLGVLYVWRMKFSGAEPALKERKSMSYS